MQPRLIARLSVVVILAVLGLFFYWSASWSLGPTLYDGDRIEERDCRMCRGEGRDPDMIDYNGGLCSFCGGDGGVDVIIPGDERPTRVWATVVNVAAIKYPQMYSPRNVRPQRPSLVDTGGGDHIGGSLSDATITLTSGDGHVVEGTTTARGRFTVLVPPGEYKVEIEANGYKSYRAKKRLIIEPLEAPIWREQAELIQPVGDGLSHEEARATYGIILVGGVSRKKAKLGFWRTFIAEPF